MDRDKRTLSRYDQQRTRDSEMLRTVTENLQRAFYTNDSISTDMKRETEKLKKEEDGIQVNLYF
jgi:predicted transglutaminase-like protease